MYENKQLEGVKGRRERGRRRLLSDALEICLKKKIKNIHIWITRCPNAPVSVQVLLRAYGIWLVREWRELSMHDGGQCLIFPVLPLPFPVSFSMQNLNCWPVKGTVGFGDGHRIREESASYNQN